MHVKIDTDVNTGYGKDTDKMDMQILSIVS